VTAKNKAAQNKNQEDIMGHWRLAIAVLMCTMFLGNVASLHETAFAADTIKLGFVADATGVGEPWYRSQKAGIDMFIDEINASGGVLGKKLELIVRDTALKAELGEAAAEELIVKEKCDFLIGPSSSGVAVPVMKVAKKHKKIVMLHTSNSESLTTTDFEPYMFEVVPNTGIESRGLAQFFALRQYKRFAYIGPDYNYARNWFSNFKTTLSKHRPDVQFVSEIWMKLGDTNFAPYLPTLAADNPDVVVTNMWGNSLEQLIRQAKPTGLFKKATLTSFFDLELLKSMGNDMPEGLLGYSRCPPYAVNERRMKEFVDKYHERYQDWPAAFAAMAYDGLLCLTEAIKKAGTTDSDKVVKTLEGMYWKSLRGDRHIRAEDHMADVGVYVGVTGKDAKYPNFLILKNVTLVPAEMVWMPVEEVKKLQPKQ
jgi:branched-chain amino acid transport system substrate-binding protein